VKADHSLTAQSTGQAWVLQARVPARAGHALPPNATSVETVRDRVWVPVPHDVLHADHADHALTTQSTGHASSLQDCFSATAPHV
jgi:hypothetical protein